MLIVDDDAGVRGLIRAALSERGHSVLDAQSGKEALRASDTHDGPIDLLVVDMGTSDANGIELAKRILERRPRSRVLLMSGLPQQRTVWPVLRKPFRLEALYAAVSDALVGRREKMADGGQTDG